jgi:hypothetical protein
MIQVCPNPNRWGRIFSNLQRYADVNNCHPPHPPKPLILSGWIYSNDLERKTRWEETVQWASTNNCLDLVEGIHDSDFYEVEELTTHQIGPLGGPMYLPWDYEEKDLPAQGDIDSYLDRLISNWESIVGKELSRMTKPLMFTGKKARRLLVSYQESFDPPWGGWSHLSDIESERRSFTDFRAAINRAISPHEVDHIEFVPKCTDGVSGN